MPCITNNKLNNNGGINSAPLNACSHSALAVSAIMNAATATTTSRGSSSLGAILNPPPAPSHSMATMDGINGTLAPPPPARILAIRPCSSESLGEDVKLIPNNHRQALSDTPAPTAPNSPHIPPKRQNSGDKIRVRPTTLDIPGLTKSSASPDGKISSIDVGSKLVIVMVGLPARGKSYITKKMARYLNWLQHDTRIFNVGERRREVAGGRSSIQQETGSEHTGQNIPELNLPDPVDSKSNSPADSKPLDQSATFFDPNNREAALIRQQCAMDTLDELLYYILHGNGSVGILDATNSTLERRAMIMRHVRDKGGADLNVLFIESLCLDKDLLERNMRLKLSGPDYKDKDPEASLADFKKRVSMYETTYIPLGEFEEKNNIPYVQMIDVGRKIITHRIKGFLSTQAVAYLLNFNLSPRQIWITRHGESEDNAAGRIGGDSELTPHGHRYSQALAIFLSAQRKEWEVHEIDKKRQAHLSPLPGDTTPPNPHYPPEGDSDHIIEKNFCVWTSMLKRSIQTGTYFNEDEFDGKQIKMLDEINAGYYEGMTYEQIKENHRDEFNRRREDKLRYRYPGPGGESYLDVINRTRPVIVELERMTDHVLLIGHRSIARVLLAYFMGLDREVVSDLDVPIGIVYCLEPKPYGVDFKAYRYDETSNGFVLEPNYKLQPALKDLA